MNAKIMFSTIMVSAAAFSMISCSSVSEDPIGPFSSPFDEPTRNMINGVNVNSYPFFAEVCANEEEGKNIMVSPLSLAEVMGMLVNGTNGESQRQIVNAIFGKELRENAINEGLRIVNNYLCNADKKTVVSIANSQWIDKGFAVKSTFIESNARYYNAETCNQELTTEKTKNDINTWCSEKTKCIRELFDKPLPSQTRMVLINTLYYHGQWAAKFDANQTMKMPFLNVDGTETDVDMMHKKDSLGLWKGKDMDVAEFEYGDGCYCMDVILPHEGKSLSECMKEITNKQMQTVFHEMKKTDVFVSMPRLEMKYSTSLVDVMWKMGVTDVFTPYKADFSKMTDNGNLFLSDVKQVTSLFVTEEGTEAAAVTAGMVELTSVKNDDMPYIFNMNRPYAFLIRDRVSGVVLFIGKIVTMRK